MSAVAVLAVVIPHIPATVRGTIVLCLFYIGISLWDKKHCDDKAK
jgi:hypothetical protein